MTGSCCDTPQSWLAITRESQFIAVDFRYFEQVGQECPHFTLFATSGGMDTWFAKLVGEAELSSKRIGFEPGDVSVASLNAMRKAIDGMPEITWARVLERRAEYQAWSDARLTLDTSIDAPGTLLAAALKFVS